MSEGYHYVAYGMGVSSPLPMPELNPAQIRPDIVIRFGAVDRSCLESVGDKQHFLATREHACYALDGAGAFQIASGSEITIDPDPSADQRTLRLCLLGPVLALALQQRGHLILHGSAVAIRGSAIGFLGSSGWGKSTVAAACHTEGHDMITDDVLAVDFSTARPFVLPSFPQFKLWPKAVTALGERVESLPTVHPEFEKRARRLTRGFSQSPVPIKGFYLLGRGTELRIERLGSHDALKALLGYWYGRRFGAPWLRALDQQSYFLRSAALANGVRISRLLRPADLSSLREQVRLLEKDLRDE